MSTASRQTTARTLIQQFAAVTNKGDLIAQLDLAQPIAASILWSDGIDSETLVENVAALAGSHQQFHTAGQDVWFDYCRHLSAAFALGVELGALVNIRAVAAARDRGRR